MKSKTIWIIVAVILVIVIIGCMTNWFGMKKPSTSATTTTRRPSSFNGVGARWIQVPNQGNTCPHGSSFGSEIGLTNPPESTQCYVSVPSVQ